MLKSTDELQQGKGHAAVQEEVRRDLLFGP
jgi:hypothetical protein